MIYTINQNKDPDTYRVYAKTSPSCSCDIPRDAAAATLHELERREEELADELCASLDTTSLETYINSIRKIKDGSDIIEHDMLSNREFISGALAKQIAPIRDAIDYIRDCIGTDATQRSRENIPFFDFGDDVMKFERFFNDSDVAAYQE